MAKALLYLYTTKKNDRVLLETFGKNARAYQIGIYTITIE